MMSPILSLQVDCAQISPAALAISEMSLSSSRAGMKAHGFVVKLDAARTISLLQPAYEAWVKESKEDDRGIGALGDALAMAGYPSLEALLQNPELLTDVLGNYLLDSLRNLFWDGSSPIEYWSDEITSCRFEDSTLYIAGICYSKPGV